MCFNILEALIRSLTIKLLKRGCSGIDNKLFINIAGRGLGISRKTSLNTTSANKIAQKAKGAFTMKVPSFVPATV